MEKKLNVRKEVFESLRLELQEFAPQEYIAACFQCLGTTYGAYITQGSESSGSNPIIVTIPNVHSAAHLIEEDNPEIYMEDFSSGYVWTNKQGNHTSGTKTHIYYYLYTKFTIIDFFLFFLCRLK